jgi:hypothetical protein
MTEFRVTPQEPLLVPDDLTVPQFLLDSTHPTRACRPAGAPWLIQEETGREVHLEEVSAMPAFMDTMSRCSTASLARRGCSERPSFGLWSS